MPPAGTYIAQEYVAACPTCGADATWVDYRIGIANCPSEITCPTCDEETP